MANKEPGYVYILTNPSFREDWVKIGKSSRPVDVRSKELDNTAVPLPFEIFATMKTTKYNEAEKLVHRYIERFTNLRIRNNREFFNVKPEEALDIFFEVATLLDDAEIERCDEKANKTIKSQMSKSSAQKVGLSSNALVEDYLAPRFKVKKVLPTYFAKLNSELTTQAIEDIKISAPISEIHDVKTLKRLRERIREIEKIHKYHGTHSCAISQLIDYIDNGFSYQDFEHDAKLIKEQTIDNLVKKFNGEAGEGVVFRSLKTMPRYYAGLNGGFIKETMKDMGILSNVSEIIDLKILEQIKTEILKKEKDLGIHHTYSCAISQYMQYIENGYSFEDLEHDALILKKTQKIKTR